VISTAATTVFDLECRMMLGRMTLDVRVACDARAVALFGPSGSGKTSVLEAIAGLRRPRDGRVVIGGRTLFDSARGLDVPARARRVGYVPQDALLFPHLTVEGNIRYGAPDGLSAFVDSAVRRLEIHPLLPRSVAALSGGERQRVALVRALASGPELLLLDEPLAALDDAMKARVTEVLLEAREIRRLPMLYVTHAREEAVSMADYAVVLHDGRVVRQGPSTSTLALTS
jgi:molybdate transport system ATP-binding protein